MAGGTKISGLMSVHWGTDDKHLRDCLASIFKQTRPLEQLVVVFDGPVDNGVGEVVAKYGEKISVVRSPVNQGLGAALDMGLAECRHPLTARFDSDDIYPPERLALQAGCFASRGDVDILGGQIDEFENTPGDIDQSRRVPETVGPDFFTVRRNPVNHMTVMFRTEEVRRIGGYSHMRLMQDYELWLRAISGGLRIANLPDTLAHARIGGDGGLYQRRRGLDNIKSELAVFRAKLKAFRFHWAPVVVLTLIARVGVRLLPSRALGAIYRVLLRR